MNKQGLQFALHLSAFMLSLLLVISISIDTFRGIAFYNDANYLDLQFWICMMLMVLFFVEVYNAERSWQYLGRHFLFLLLIIPYLTLFDWWGVELPGQTEYLFHFT